MMSGDADNLSAEQVSNLIDQALFPEDKNHHGDTPYVDDTSNSTVENTAEQPVIVAPDGKHTISYDELIKARQEVEQLRQQLVQQKTEQPSLNHENSSPQQVAQQVIEQGADPALFGTFSEDDLAKGINTLVEQRVAELVNKQLAPLQQREQQLLVEQHFNTIYTAHPDADSITESQEFSQWIEQQPSFMQSAYRTVMEQGSAQDVVQLLEMYKQQTGLNQPVQQPATKEKTNSITTVPNSLSDFPSGRPQGVSAEERLANLTPAQLMEEMQNWTPEQIEQFLNRRV